MTSQKFLSTPKLGLVGIRTRLLVVLSIFHFVEFPYILTIFLLNSREIFTKSRFDVTRKSVTSRTRAIIILPRSFILRDEDVLIHPRFQGLFPTPQGPGNEDGADRVYATQKTRHANCISFEYLFIF